MKLKMLSLMIATGIATIAHADFTFYSSEPGSCEYILGNWVGTGKASNWIIGKCVYRGTGAVSLVDNKGTFKVIVTANKESGNSICPNQASRALTAICQNGNVTIKTEYGNLKGNFSQNTGSAKGSLPVAPGIEVDVDILFNRG